MPLQVNPILTATNLTYFFAKRRVAREKMAQPSGHEAVSDALHVHRPDVTSGRSEAATCGLMPACRPESSSSFAELLVEPRSSTGDAENAEHGMAEADDGMGVRCSQKRDRGAALTSGTDGTEHTSGSLLSCQRLTRARTVHDLEAAVQPQQRLEAAVVAQRAAAMFAMGSRFVCASNAGEAVDQPTNELVKLVHDEVTAWPEARVKGLSQSLGNFDREVARGWLISDLLGYAPAITRQEAFTLGSAVRRRALKLERDAAAIADKQRREAGKQESAQKPDREALARAVEAATQPVLQDTVRPPLPLPESRPASGHVLAQPALTEKEQLQHELKAAQRREAAAARSHAAAQATFQAIQLPPAPNTSTDANADWDGKLRGRLPASEKQKAEELRRKEERWLQQHEEASRMRQEAAAAMASKRASVDAARRDARTITLKLHEIEQAADDAEWEAKHRDTRRFFEYTGQFASSVSGWIEEVRERG